MTAKTPTEAPEISTKTWKIIAQFDKYDDARVYAKMELPDEFLKGIDYKIKYAHKTNRFSVRTIATQKKTKNNR